jgi:hypothetical protein
VETFLWQQKKAKHVNLNLPGYRRESVWFQMSQLTDYLDMGKVGPNSSQMRELADCLIRLGCQRPGRAGSRHPETQLQAKWWVYVPPEQKEVAS